MMEKCRKFFFTNWNRADIGLLIVRLGMGASMALFHGWGKIAGGPERWERIGANMGNLGIHFLPPFWGFMSGFAEFFCSLLLVLGLFFRPALFFLIINMLVAVTMHLSLPPEARSAGWSGAAHALEFLSVFLALFLIGPGKYTLELLWKREKEGEG